LEGSQVEKERKRGKIFATVGYIPSVVVVIEIQLKSGEHNIPPLDASRFALHSTKAETQKIIIFAMHPPHFLGVSYAGRFVQRRPVLEADHSTPEQDRSEPKSMATRAIN